jgi:ketosteroid isomerase-like protein
VARLARTSNKQLLTAIFDALSVGDTRPFVDAMAEDFRWRFAGEWSWVRDWGATKREVRENLLRPLMEQFLSYRAHAEEILADGDRVVVRARAIARTTRGEGYPQAYCYVFGVTDGRLSEVIEYCDSALVERVLELPAPSRAQPDQ